jgi:hypothetical protein
MEASSGHGLGLPLQAIQQTIPCKVQNSRTDLEPEIALAVARVHHHVKWAPESLHTFRNRQGAEEN